MGEKRSRPSFSPSPLLLLVITNIFEKSSISQKCEFQTSQKAQIVARTAPLPPILGGSEIEVPQNWGLKAFQAYMKRGQVQGM